MLLCFACKRYLKMLSSEMTLAVVATQPRAPPSPAPLGSVVGRLPTRFSLGWL